MKPLLFFVDHMKMCETSFWIDYICRELNTSGIVATNGNIHSSFRRSSLLLMSDREAFKASRDCICISFSEYSSGIEKLISCTSCSKILYVNCMTFLYERFKSEKNGFLEQIDCLKDNVDIYVANNSYSRYIADYKGVVSPWESEKWKIILEEKTKNFKEVYYAKH